MSFAALTWAMKCRVGSAAKKLVLLGLADAAHKGKDTAYPSVARLAEVSELDRKTVMAALAELERGGIIVDTGQREGRTHQVKVFRLCMETVPETGRFKGSRKRNSSENGTLSQGAKKVPQNSILETIPKTGLSQKRDTEPDPTDLRDNRTVYDAEKPKRTPPPAKPEDVSEEVWNDWLQHRKVRRASVNATVVGRLQREALRAGWTFEDALAVSVVKGWTSYEAPWLERLRDGGRHETKSLFDVINERNERLAG